MSPFALSPPFSTIPLYLTAIYPLEFRYLVRETGCLSRIRSGKGFPNPIDWGLPLPVLRYGLEPCSADWPHGQARRRELTVLQVPPAAKGVRLPGAGPSAWVWAEPFSIHLVGSCYRRG